MEGLNIIKVGMPSIACCMGMKRPCPTGMPKGACWIFSAIFWNLLSDIFSCFRMDLIFLQISFDFFGGSWMVYFVPYMIHPKISFMGSHVPSP